MHGKPIRDKTDTLTRDLRFEGERISMKSMLTVLGLVTLTLSMTGCTPTNRTNGTDNGTNGAAGFANQAVDSLPTPHALHQGTGSPTNRSSAMGLNNSGMASRIGAIDLGTLGGNSTVQIDTRTKTVTMVVSPHTSTSAADARHADSANPAHNQTQRMTGISIPTGWTLRAVMRSNSGAGTHGGAAALSVVPYGPNRGGQGNFGTGAMGNNQGAVNWSAGPTGRTGYGRPAGVSFKANRDGIYAVLMHQTGVQPRVVTIVSVTPTIRLPVVSFPSS